MRYRKEIDGDYVFGLATGSTSEFWINTPEAVAQAVMTRLRLMTGEWFLDLSEGTPYATQILGKGTMQLYDMAIKRRVLRTAGVVQITSYKSAYDGATRSLAIDIAILTSYSRTPIVLPTLGLTGAGIAPVPRTDPFGNIQVSGP